ncbi:unnamed protein product [Adineta steineri]|uniref:Uncharacterized protein n=1 Tax=Adineta steineri TaxID=433720 RepID=A0A816BEJ7_9BILA|nr:unnamed protein product [Adineta steineri]CAF1609808.1 unnamed protein product [Adineta steineri]
MKILPVVSTHVVPGQTDVCYTSNGNYYITCGQDGDVHVFNTESVKVKSIHCDNQCYCLAVHERYLFVGTNQNEVQIRLFPQVDSLSDFLHVNHPVSAVSLSNSSLCVGTRDFKVLIVNLNDDPNKMKYFIGHQAPILAVNVYEERKLLATSCCDGFVRIFNTDTQILIKQLDVIQKSNNIETASSQVKIDWDKTDQLLAIPVENTIQFYESHEWTRMKEYKNNTNDGIIHLASYSPCRTWLIVTYVNGQLSILNRQTLDVCMNYSSTYFVCSLAWNPKEPHRFTCVTMAGEHAHVNILECLSKPTLTSSEKKKNEFEKITTNSEEYDIESVSNDIQTVSENKKVIPTRLEHASSMLTETKPVEFQESFQSTSTSKYLQSRFLLWNNIGAITCHDEKIKISFHDKSYHDSITIDNKTYKYSVADLSLSAVVLGSSQTGKLYCILYQSLNSDMREWTMNIENNDKVELVSLGEDFLAVATSQRFVRVMNLSGTQQQSICLQGPIVSMSIYQNQFWIIHHSIQDSLKEQTISYIYTDNKSTHHITGLLPLISKLIWMGFSDSGKCYYLEESGHLSMLRHTNKNEFESVLILNLKQEANKNNVTDYWLLKISDFDDKFQLHVIELHERSFPNIVPWPVVSIISPSLALSQLDTEETQLKSDYFTKKSLNRSPYGSSDDEEYLHNKRPRVVTNAIINRVKCAVNVKQGKSGISTTTITTDKIAGCLFYLIDGVLKNQNFVYLYHSDYVLDRKNKLFDNFNLLLSLFVRELKMFLTSEYGFNVNIDDLEGLRLFVGGGIMDDRNPEREAISLLSNSNDSTYEKITSLLAGQHQHLSLFKKLVNRTVIIKPVAYDWTEEEQQEAESNDRDLILPSRLELLYDCQSKMGQIIVEWNEEENQLDLAHMNFNVLQKTEEEYKWAINANVINKKNNFDNVTQEILKKALSYISSNSFFIYSPSSTSLNHD